MKQSELDDRIRSITAVHSIPNHPGAKGSAREIEADQVRSLVRDVVEAVKPEHRYSFVDGDVYIDEDDGEFYRVGEIEAKMEELGL